MYFIQSSYGNIGNFEAILLEGNRLVHYWRPNDDPVHPWYRGGVFGNAVDSLPALIQSNFGNLGNFEIVVKEGNRLRHYWRDNDAPGFPWQTGPLFGDNVDSAPAFIQSSFGNIGNFEVVVREGNRLRHYWRNNDVPGYPWQTGPLFGDNVNSSPAMIKSNYGSRGNFEVLVREGNQLRHYWRNNDAADYPWQKGVLFGDHVDSAPAFIQGSIGNIGNFEVMVREGDKLRHYWRNNDASGYPWQKGSLLSDHITHEPSLIQSNFGGRGNFELLTKRGNCFVHFWRSNDAVNLPWSGEMQLHASVPLGSPPTAAQNTKFRNWFPNLRNYHITSPNTVVYNCISWSVGVTSQWLWPGDTVSAFDAFYASYGWTTSANGNREYKKRKVALWAKNTDCTHGSRETSDCDWHESKCGSAERIMHDKYQMQGGSYGNIIKYYEKHDPNANLDLV